MEFRRVGFFPVFFPGGEDWQSSSFSGGVFIETSPKEWQIWMAWMLRQHSGLDRVKLIGEGYAR